jgi:hypothetical protein
MCGKFGDDVGGVDDVTFVVTLALTAVAVVVADLLSLLFGAKLVDDVATATTGDKNNIEAKIIVARTKDFILSR